MCIYIYICRVVCSTAIWQPAAGVLQSSGRMQKCIISLLQMWTPGLLLLLLLITTLIIIMFIVILGVTMLLLLSTMLLLHSVTMLLL